MWNTVYKREKPVSSDFSGLKSECLQFKSEPHSKGVLFQSLKLTPPDYWDPPLFVSRKQSGEHI